MSNIDDWDRYELEAAAMPTRCTRCGKDPAEGLASIGDDRYCHGDDTPSCYELASIDAYHQRGEQAARDYVRGWFKDTLGVDVLQGTEDDA